MKMQFTYFSSTSSNKPRWENVVDGHVPVDAFKAGRERNAIVYIAKAFHNYDLIPGKRISGHTHAYVSFGGEEVAKENYKVLCGYAYYWVPYPSSEGCFPIERAVIGGKTANGEHLYIARVVHKGVDVIGKVIIALRILVAGI